jgi:hypothetical protein
VQISAGLSAAQSALQLQSFAHDPRSPLPGPPRSPTIVELKRQRPFAGVPDAGPAQPQEGSAPIVQFSAHR